MGFKNSDQTPTCTFNNELYKKDLYKPNLGSRNNRKLIFFCFVCLCLQPTQEPEPWEGVRKVNTLNAACTQGQVGIIWLTHPGWSKYSEDCLYANIYAPNVSAFCFLCDIIVCFTSVFMFSVAVLPQRLGVV